MAHQRPSATLDTVIILMSAILLLLFKSGFCVTKTSISRRICSRQSCVIIEREMSDFTTAVKRCLASKGMLLHLPPHLFFDDRASESVIEGLKGDFWTGLSLPADKCSNISTPLRGYTSSSSFSRLPASFSWKDNAAVCSPQCVSISHDSKLTERHCSDRIDGFLCNTGLSVQFQAEESSHLNFFQSETGCFNSSCRQICRDVKGGFECSCFKGYKRDIENPKACLEHCEEERCPAKCYGWFNLNCECLPGFTLQNYLCVNGSKPPKTTVSTPAVKDSGKPALRDTNHPRIVSSLPFRSFLGMWTFISVAVVLIICMIVLYAVTNQKKRAENSDQNPADPEGGN